MNDNNKNSNIVDPETGAPLIPKGDSLYFSEYTGVYFRINKDGKVTAIRDTETGAPLIPKGDSLYFSEYTGVYFRINKDGKVTAIRDTETGAPLIPKGDSLYFSEYTGVYFRINKDDKVTAIRDPEIGAPLIPKPDGTYYSEYLNGPFIYDEKRENYIPLFIMDLTKEPAHIEGDFLVGNNSNRKFPILPYGGVLIPLHETKQLKTLEQFQDEKDRLFNQPQSEINKLLNIQYFNYKNEIVDKIDKKMMAERKTLKENLESEIQDQQNKVNEKLKQRGNKLNFIMDLYVKMTRGEYISSKEIEILNEYKKDGLLSEEIDEINSYYNSILSNALEEGRKL